MSSEKGDLVMLEDPKKLRKLASIILNQEEALMTWVDSEPERVKYLENCNDSYDGVIKLLEGSQELVEKHKESNEDIVKIVEDIQHYIHYGMNMSMQCIRNCALRVTSIKKIQAHFADLVKVVGELPPDDVAATRRLAEEVTMFKDYMWKYTNSCFNATSRAKSQAYSALIKQENLTFEKLVTKQKNELGLAAEFEELEEAEQLRVYKGIIEESGRATLPILEKISTAGGVAVLIVAAGLIAFDIFESEYKIEAIVRNTFNLATDVGVFAVQIAVESAIVSEIEFETAGMLLVAAGSFIAATVVGLIFAAAGGALLDLIFSSGGKVQPHMIGKQYRKMEFPDGMAIAFEISHDDD
ncbi:hypothetical protein RND81_10G029700 [Saponaria officinalis]